MDNKTEVIFENIEQRILKEIKDAHYAIFVSVAWFTNKKLFNALFDKAKDNCYVSIIIQLDDINSQCGIDYSQIQTGRSECFMISKDAELFHDKFCVIDFRKVITGSYNWTYKASHNSENVVVISDPTIATQYIARFEQQKSKFVDSNFQQNLSPKIISENLNDAPKKEVIKPVILAPPPTPQKETKIKCLNCNKELENNDLFCGFCGKQQNDLRFKRVVKCKKCKREQEAALLDAKRTNYCTFCGSNNLIFERIEI